MRPILFHIPAIPAAGWIALVAAFFGLSAYWGVRDLAAAEIPDAERRRGQISTIVTNAVLFLVSVLLLWKFRAAVAHPLPVRAYGFMLMLGFGAALLLIRHLSRGSALPPEGVLDLILGALLVTIVTSRALFVLLNWSDYSGHWRDWLRVWEGGLSFHGGLIGGVAWVSWYAWRHRLRPLWLTDLVVPGVALGYAITRVGCFLNGCCYGTPTSLPWAVQFHDPPLSANVTPPSHPVQLYATVLNLVICAYLVRMVPRRRFDGQILATYFVLYSIYRFLAEALRRGVTGQVSWLGMTQGQWASIAIILLGVAMLHFLRKRAAGVAPDPSGLMAGARPPAPQAGRDAGRESRPGPKKRRK